jgi:hypothetical protein
MPCRSATSSARHIARSAFATVFLRIRTDRAPPRFDSARGAFFSEPAAGKSYCFSLSNFPKWMIWFLQHRCWSMRPSEMTDAARFDRELKMTVHTPKLLTPEEFASLIEIAISSPDPTIPALHLAKLISLGYVVVTAKGPVVTGDGLIRITESE